MTFCMQRMHDSMHSDGSTNCQPNTKITTTNFFQFSILSLAPSLVAPVSAVVHSIIIRSSAALLSIIL